MSEPTITLYTRQTPNGIKISITLEELNLPYKTYNIDAPNHEQNSPWFLEINPNGRIPAITDGDIRVFESGSTMQYLVERYDPEYRISPYAIQRYQDETRRLYGVLDKHLQSASTPYLVGNKCTIADIATWPWVTLARWSLGGEHHPKSPLDEFPSLKAWEERMFGREGVERGRQVPEVHQREMLRDPVRMEAFEQKGREFYERMAREKVEAEKEAEKGDE
ncbi:hypothetical protein PRZ48_004329 [Zasmidium cellare]|uniref:Glutathione S-transferase n=1 Tax=Zasmidium cellare TaxID=395010 RepID=A0ABR0EPW1_ZASCE|nr:hypothetical protein PRZ48_004329 [Zasmidium cellare]